VSKVSEASGNGHWSLESVVNQVNMVSNLRRLKASIPSLKTTFPQFHDIRYFDAFAAGSLHLKKSSGGPEGL
jgi:hypothetical protein